MLLKYGSIISNKSLMIIFAEASQDIICSFTALATLLCPAPKEAVKINIPKSLFIFSPADILIINDYWYDKLIIALFSTSYAGYEITDYGDRMFNIFMIKFKLIK